MKAADFFLASFIQKHDTEWIRSYIQDRFETRCWIEYLPTSPENPVFGIDSPEVWERPEFQAIADFIQREGRRQGLECAVCLIQPDMAHVRAESLGVCR